MFIPRDFPSQRLRHWIRVWRYRRRREAWSRWDARAEPQTVRPALRHRLAAVLLLGGVLCLAAIISVTLSLRATSSLERARSALNQARDDLATGSTEQMVSNFETARSEFEAPKATMDNPVVTSWARATSSRRQPPPARKRLVYTSSVAAYGFHRGMPALLDGGRAGAGHLAPSLLRSQGRGRGRAAEALARLDTDAYVFRPCIVAGPEATLLLDLIPLLAVGSGFLARCAGRWQGSRAAAGAARPRRARSSSSTTMMLPPRCAAAVFGHGEPGVYNLAGPGQLTITDLAHALGWHAVPAPHLAVGVAAEAVALMPFLPDEAAWIEAVRRPVLMDTARARSELGWHPQFHAHRTLRLTVAARATTPPPATRT